MGFEGTAIFGSFSVAVPLRLGLVEGALAGCALALP